MIEITITQQKSWRLDSKPITVGDYIISVEKETCSVCGKLTTSVGPCRCCKRPQCDECMSFLGFFDMMCLDCDKIYDEFQLRYRAKKRLGLLTPDSPGLDDFSADNILLDGDSVSCVECLEAKASNQSCKFHGSIYQTGIKVNRK